MINPNILAKISKANLNNKRLSKMIESLFIGYNN
jgi:hypothetical protein